MKRPRETAHVAGGLNHNQPGDPSKLAEVLVVFANAPNPPVRLPLGSDTVAGIEAKHKADSLILSEWRTVSLSTDFYIERMVRSRESKFRTTIQPTIAFPVTNPTRCNPQPLPTPD